jgi:hypothetical protein
MCLGVTTELHTGERAKTGCLGGMIMCLGVTTDLHTVERAKIDYLGGRIMFPSVTTDLHTGERAKTGILPPRQPVFALSPVCRSVVTIGHIILPPR